MSNLNEVKQKSFPTIILITLCFLSIGFGIIFYLIFLNIELAIRILVGTFSISFILIGVIYVTKQSLINDHNAELRRTERMKIRLDILEKAQALDIRTSNVERLEARVKEAEMKLSGNVAELVDDNEK